MKEQIFPPNRVHTTRKKQKTTLENPYGAIDIQRKNDQIAVDFRRKREFHEPVFENSREKLEEGHEYRKKTPHGTFVTDSKNKRQSAVQYQESRQSSNEKILKNLYQLKEMLPNQTLHQLLPNDPLLVRKLKLEIDLQKKLTESRIAQHMDNISRQMDEDDTETAQDDEENASETAQDDRS